MTTQVLQEVVKRGTGTKARLVDHQVAGKTGTAEDNSDAWFVGYTPQLATAIWMGAPTGQVALSFGGGATGGRYPAATFGQMYGEILKDQPIVQFTDPEPVKGSQYLRLAPKKSTKKPPRSNSKKPPTTTEPGRPPGGGDDDDEGPNIGEPVSPTTR